MVALVVLSTLSGCGNERDGTTTPDATTGASSPHQVQCGVTDPTLAQLAKARGKTVGTAYRSTYAANDPCYHTVALAEFDSLTTEIGTMMNTVQPAPGVFDFREADAVADLATEHHKDFQIHSLIWDPLDQPQWNIVPPTIRALPPQARHQFMVDSVTTIMKRYAGRASTVTVVNEAFDQMGHLQPNTWWDTTHSDQYIFDAFRAARLADPTAQLYYNDHTAETNSDKSNAIYNLVKRLRDTTVDVEIDGQPTTKPLIDGIGFQGHMLGGANQQPNISDIETNLQRFADLGVSIRFTELDVRIPVLNGTATVADLDRQRLVYNMMTQVCLNQPRCTGLTLWGFTDKRSWITDYPDTFSGYGAATPFAIDYRRKPAWTGIADALK
ncbi:glycoside hydrolase [Mycolicibacterium wolinskyi]|uniref:endo-1,4-beta-xylanase n=1 Tax=Mycolicibacterium wolinskyi TaxID=59750 RepID=A0A132PR34_9MYCO|nr:glycoside hydrolase [Mycolicibacterium wolinskyi]